MAERWELEVGRGGTELGEEGSWVCLRRLERREQEVRVRGAGWGRWE